MPPSSPVPVPAPAAPARAAHDPASPADAVTIRLVRTEEYARAGEVTAAAYLASYGALSDGYLASLRDVASRVRAGDVWVAVDDTGEIVGTVWVSRPNRALNPDIGRPGETDFRQLAVAPSARGRGIGAALTRHVIALARERGSHRVVMNSGPEMTGAHSLYAKLGFRRLPDREQARELEPGRIVTLLAFGYDLAPAPAPPAERAPDERGRLLEVPWADTRAAALRELMDAEVGPRYADRFRDGDPSVAERAFAVDPATIVATLIALDDDGTPVGHAALRDLAHDGIRDLEIKRFFVHPRARGRGVSRALLAELERIAQHRGARRLILQTGDRQHDAVALYEKAGYTPIGIYEPYTPFAFSHCFAKEIPAQEVPASGPGEP